MIFCGGYGVLAALWTLLSLSMNMLPFGGGGQFADNCELWFQDFSEVILRNKNVSS